MQNQAVDIDINARKGGLAGDDAFEGRDCRICRSFCMSLYGSVNLGLIIQRFSPFAGKRAASAASSLVYSS